MVETRDSEREETVNAVHSPIDIVLMAIRCLVILTVIVLITVDFIRSRFKC